MQVLFEHQFARLRKQVSEQSIEALSEVASELKVLGLVFADWNVGGLVEQDVSSHQYGVGIQAQTRQFVALPFLFFELNHPVEPAERCEVAEEPLHLGVSADVRLHEQRALLRVDAASE